MAKLYTEMTEAELRLEADSETSRIWDGLLAAKKANSEVTYATERLRAVLFRLNVISGWRENTPKEAG